MANIDAAAVKQAVQRHPDFIVGLKARMSSSVVGENGITRWRAPRPFSRKTTICR